MAAQRSRGTQVEFRGHEILPGGSEVVLFGVLKTRRNYTIIAGAAMSLSSVSVIANALRLRGVKLKG